MHLPSAIFPPRGHIGGLVKLPIHQGVQHMKRRRFASLQKPSACRYIVQPVLILQSKLPQQYIAQYRRHLARAGVRSWVEPFFKDVVRSYNFSQKTV